LQTLRKKTAKASYSGALLKSLAKQSAGTFKGFRQFATDFTQGQEKRQPKRKKKKSLWDY